MKRLTLTGLFLAALLALSSCLRDDLQPCPPLQVTLSVKDKNYFNVASAQKLGMAEPVDENLPFRSYVSTLYYVLHDEQGNVVAEQTNYAVENDNLEETIVFPVDLPYGKYVLTVWGNMQSDRPLGDDWHTVDEQDEDVADNDIYLTTDTLDYAYGTEQYRADLERTKGRLVIKAEGVPDNIDFSYKKVSGVYSVINNRFEYTGLTEVETRTDWLAPNEITTHTLLCPSEAENKTRLSVYFADKEAYNESVETTSGLSRAGGEEEQILIHPEDVSITMRRNEMTVLKYVYTERGMDIYLLVNDRWEKVHQMEMD